MSQSKAILAGSVGNALEWFDYGLYGYFAPVIASLYFPADEPLTSLMLSLAVFGAGFVMRPLGGLLFGHYADTAGRRQALSATVILMGLSTFAVGCLPTYEQIGLWAPVWLTFFRLLQGISTGGEWGSCMSFLAEYSTPDNRGFVVSWSQFSVAAGLLLGSAGGAVLTTVLEPEEVVSWGWRIPFWCGILIAWYGIYVRSYVDETPQYQMVKSSGAVTDLPARELAKKYRKEMLVTVGVVIGWTISYWMTMAYMPTYISQVLNYPFQAGLSFHTVLLIIFLCAIPFAGMLSDRMGRKPVMIVGAAGILLFTYPLFYLLGAGTSPAVVLLALGVLAILQALLCGGATVFVSEIFPIHVRCSAIGAGYNITVAIFGGMAPFTATWLIQWTGNPLAPTFYLMAGMAVTILVLLFMAEETHTKPSDNGRDDALYS